MKSVHILSIAAVTVALAACNNQPKSGVGITLSNLDTTTSPTDNFYQYANGSWLANNPIPASESRWGSFNILDDETRKSVKVLLDEAATAKAEKGTIKQKVGDFYASGMDSATIEKLGITALDAQWKQIDAIKATSDVQKEVAHLQRIGVAPLFSFYAYQDPKNSAVVVPQAYQGGLGLPDRDYYIAADKATIRKEYAAHITKMFALAGYDGGASTAAAKSVMQLETALAKASKERAALRDPNANYHKMTVEELNKLTPNLNWGTLLTDMGVKKMDYVIVGQPAFFTEVNTLLTTVPVADWKTYLKWQTLTSFAGQLSSNFVNENFRFYGTTLTGAKEIKPRWKRVLATTDAALGEALGQLYVEKYFPAAAKKRCLELVKNLQEVYADRINKLEWMSATTKEKAQKKLGTIINKIGYPDTWKDYSKLEIERTNYLQNCIGGNELAFDKMLEKIGQPVDKNEWLMTPQTVNAYYNPQTNEIAFPAAILQPPFFDPNADDAVNYGGIGAVIGHELTHGFDDQGRQYDADGNLTDWWTKEDGEKFNKLTQVVVDQYNAYKVLDSIPVNGSLTLGENIADLGGLSIAYEAFKRTEQGKKNEKIDGFTAEQRFFLNWANVWRNNIRDEALKQRIVVDPHSPGIYRANGPVSNMPEFYAAFNVTEGSPMWRADSIRAKIW